MSKEYLKDLGKTGVYQFGEKYYVSVRVEDGVPIDKCHGMVKTKWWNYPVFETTSDDPRVIKAKEEEELKNKREKDLKNLRIEIIERVKQIYPEIFKDSESNTNKSEISMLENRAIASLIFNSPKYGS